MHWHCTLITSSFSFILRECSICIVFNCFSDFFFTAATCLSFLSWHQNIEKQRERCEIHSSITAQIDNDKPIEKMTASSGVRGSDPNFGRFSISGDFLSKTANTIARIQHHCKTDTCSPQLSLTPWPPRIGRPYPLPPRPPFPLPPTHPPTSTPSSLVWQHPPLPPSLLCLRL